MESRGKFDSGPGNFTGRLICGAMRRFLFKRQDSRPKRLQEQINLSLRIEPAQADPNQTTRTFFLVAHRKQHTRWFSRMVRGASATCRRCDAGMIEHRKQLPRFTFPPAETETQMPRQALRGVSETISIWKHLYNLSRDLLAKLRQPRSFFCQFFACNLGCHAKTNNTRNVLRCCSKPPFLSAAEHNRRKLHSLANVKRTDALRPVKLVRRER